MDNKDKDEQTSVAGAAKGGNTSIDSLRRYHHNEFDNSIHADPCGEFVNFDDVAAYLASQSQAAQPSELAEKLRNHHARDIWDWDILLDAATMIEHLAGQSQATRAVPDGYVDIESVKSLCRDYSSRTGSVYIKDVESALDGLIEPFAAPTAQEAAKEAKSTLLSVTERQVICASGDALLAGLKPGDVEYDLALVRNLGIKIDSQDTAQEASQDAARVPDLHNAIMNLPDNGGAYEGRERTVYKLGHRDARHAAAELAIGYVPEQEAATGSTSSAPAESAAFRALNAQLAAFRAALEPYRYDSDEEAIAKVRELVRADVERRASGDAAQEVTQQAVPADDDDLLDVIYPPRAKLKREDWDVTTRKPKVVTQQAAKAETGGAQERLCDEGSFYEVAKARGFTDFGLTISGNYSDAKLQALRERYDSDLAPTTSTVSAPTEVRDALQFIHDTFNRDLDQGYKTRDKEFAVGIAAQALHASSSTEGAQKAPEEVRNQALEQAARVAEETDVATFTHAMVLHDDGSQTRSDIAKAIRALKRTTSGKGEAA